MCTFIDVDIPACSNKVLSSFEQKVLSFVPDHEAVPAWKIRQPLERTLKKSFTLIEFQMLLAGLIQQGLVIALEKPYKASLSILVFQRARGTL